MSLLINPKNDKSGTESGIEEIKVLIDSEGRGERRGDSSKLHGVDVRVEWLDSVRRVRVEGLGGDDDHLGFEVMEGLNVGSFCVGDCIGTDIVPL